MVTIIEASVYSMNKGTEMAYEITYSEGTKVRAVESRDQIIRKEYLKDGKWLMSGKPYKVQHNKKRDAETIKKTVTEYLK